MHCEQHSLLVEYLMHLKRLKGTDFTIDCEETSSMFTILFLSYPRKRISQCCSLRPLQRQRHIHAILPRAAQPNRRHRTACSIHNPKHAVGLMTDSLHNVI
jgi:hypothetical protein